MSYNTPGPSTGQGDGSSGNGMTPIIAVRTMIRTADDGSTTTFTVNIGQPMPTPTGSGSGDPNIANGAWYCTIQIIGIYTTNPVVFSYGEDAVTALMMSMYTAGTILTGLPYASQIDYGAFANFLFPIPPIASIMAGITGT